MSDGGAEKTWLRKTRNAFLTGIAVLFPLAATLWILSLLYNVVLGPISRPMRALLGQSVPPAVLNLIVLYFLFKLVMIVGFLTRSYVGKGMIRLIERAVNQIPIFRNIYNASKEVVDAITDQSRPHLMRVVLIEYPQPGMQSLAFVTREDLSSVKDVNQQELAQGMLGVFIPTAPNPTSGYFTLVPRAKVVPLGMSVEDAWKLIFSVGVLGPKSATTPLEN